MFICIDKKSKHCTLILIWNIVLFRGIHCGVNWHGGQAGGMATTIVSLTRVLILKAMSCCKFWFYRVSCCKCCIYCMPPGEVKIYNMTAIQRTMYKCIGKQLINNDFDLIMKIKINNRSDEIAVLYIYNMFFLSLLVGHIWIWNFGTLKTTYFNNIIRGYI